MRQRRIKLFIVLLTILIINSGCDSTKNIQISELEENIKGLEMSSEEVITLKEQIKKLEQELRDDSEVKSDDIKENVDKTSEEILEIVTGKVMEWMNYDNVEVIESNINNLYMVRAEKATFSDGYFLYNSSEDKLFIMPTGGNDVSSYVIEDSNHIQLFMTGKHSETFFQGIPFIYDCWKLFLDNGDTQFMSVRKDKYFLLEEELYFGGKGGQKLEDVIVTLNGIQVAFGPQDPSDSMYYAGSVYPPYTSASFDKKNNQFVVSFEDTIIDDTFTNMDFEIDENHGYIEKILFEKENNSILMIVKLKEYSDHRELDYYTSKILHSLTTPTAVEFKFHNELPHDY